MQGSERPFSYISKTLELGETMLVFYKNWQGIGKSPVRNEFHCEALAEQWNGYSWQGIRRYPVSFLALLVETSRAYAIPHCLSVRP